MAAASTAPPRSAARQLARIDFSPFAALPLDAPLRIDQRHEAVAAQIDAAIRRDGVLLLCNLPLSEQQLSPVFHAAHQLFALPLHHKLHRVRRLTKASNWGYIADGMEVLNRQRRPDLKEAYNYKNPAETDITFEGCPRNFDHVCHQFYTTMAQIGRRFGVACALALKLPLDHFTNALQKLDMATLRLIHYPPCNFVRGQSTGEDQHAPIRVGEHTDYGFFTLLFCDGAGLQVQRHGEWLDVPPSGTQRACAIVTVGALMARLTNDTWNASVHRVVVKHQQMAATSRYTVACFFDPDRQSVIHVHRNFVSERRPAKYPPITSHAYEYGRVHEAIDDE